MRKFLAIASVSAIALSAGAARADYVLDILHFNDMHSRIESINKFNSTCSAEDEKENKCFGGIARMKTKIDERRVALGKSANVLVLDAGDDFQGSLFYTTYKGKDTAEFLNLINPDAMAVGNHEFDDGPEVLANFIEMTNFPILSGNTIVTQEPALVDKLPGYIVVEKGGEKIGIVSVLATDTGETSSPGDKIFFVDTVSYVKFAVKKLEEMGVNKIVALTHVGLEEDKRIAANVPGLDVIVGGHSHTLLSNKIEGATDVYPVMVENPDKIKVPIVQAAAYSKYLGEVSINFDDNGVVTAAFGEPHLLDSSVVPDALFMAKVEGYRGPLEEIKNKKVSSTSDVIDGERDTCRLAECSMGNLVADAMLERVKNQGVSIAIQNGGGLRASIDAGEILMGEVLTVLPFQNSLATFGLKGSDIITSLEQGVSETAEIKGRFPQVSGLRYAWDETVEPLKGRIQQVQVMEDGKWVDIDPNKEYKVVSNDFMRAGGDGYKLFKENASNAYDFGPSLEDVVAEYLAANNPYKPYTDGRILKGAKFEMAIAEAPKAEAPKVEAPKAETMVKVEPVKAEPVKTEAPKTEIMAAGDYVIQPNDTLWKIAIAKYGDPQRWKEIESLNGVKNVRHLKIGNTIKLPK